MMGYWNIGILGSKKEPETHLTFVAFFHHFNIPLFQKRSFELLV